MKKKKPWRTREKEIDKEVVQERERERKREGVREGWDDSGEMERTSTWVEQRREEEVAGSGSCDRVNGIKSLLSVVAWPA